MTFCFLLVVVEGVGLWEGLVLVGGGGFGFGGGFFLSWGGVSLGGGIGAAGEGDGDKWGGIRRERLSR